MTIPKKDRPKIPPTKAQLEFIESLEEYGLGVPIFTGTTKAEASEFINEHKDCFPRDPWKWDYM